jgi:signal transduction histidine kinase
MTISEPQRSLVLYVDDERPNRLVFEASLPKAEFEVITADSGERALEILQTREPAVIVTDMRMPGMEGDQLLAIVKDRHPSIVRMVMTAHQDIGPILKAINEGLVVRYIVKPFDRGELVQVVRWGCQTHRFRTENESVHTRLIETERLATLGSIAALLVHDLRQPLMSQLVNIEHVSELAKDSAAIEQALATSTVAPDVKKRILSILVDLPQTLDDIKHSAMHLNDMISNLRELGKPHVPESGVAIDPLPVIKQAMSSCQEAAVKARGVLSYHGPAELPNVRINRTELLQVVINVISNAAQAVGRRESGPGSVKIHAQVAADVLVVSVVDNGPGMAEETLAKVGTPFFTTRKEGTGLGISQCHRLIGAAGGRFRIDSKVGEGATVTIALPIATSA